MPLLCDTDHSIVRGFGVERGWSGLAERSTFLIDADGTIRKVYPEVKVKGHAAAVLAEAKRLWS
jgi:peroxiredoxin Q/BCP